MIGICVQHGQVKIGIILRCHNVKTLSGCMMTGVLLWLCWMIVEEYMLGCWMDECIWLECIPCSVWWPLKIVQMVWKMDFDGVIGWEKLIFFDRLQIPVDGSSANSLWLPGGVCLWIDHVWNFWKCTCSFFGSHHLAGSFIGVHQESHVPGSNHC